MVKVLDITTERWDYLVILDACRFDYFEKNYRNYFNSGNLKIKRTAGTSTVEWRNISFKSGAFEDIIYISANPNITDKTSIYDFIGANHFFKVFEIWKTNWDSYRGTVLPEKMTDVSLDIINQYKNQGKRFILHYLQPHEPYLMPTIVSCGYDRGEISSERRLIGYNYSSFLYDQRFGIFNFLMNHTGFLSKFTNRKDWYLRQFLGLPPRCPMDGVRRKYGKKKLRKAYEQNLRYALEQVKRLTEQVSGKVVITSDHGELLGDKNCYGHPSGSDNPILRNVPWFELDCKQADKQQVKSDSDDIEIKEKLKSIGYVD